MDENKIPQKGILGNTSSAVPSGNVPFVVPQKRQALIANKRVILSVPQKKQSLTNNGVPQKARLPEQNKTLEPTVDLTTLTTPSKPRELNIKNDYAPNPSAVFPNKTAEIMPKPFPDDFKKPENSQQVPVTATTENVSEKSPAGVSSDLPTLRTYKKDVAGAIKDQKTSLVRMVLEEQKDRYRRETDESPRSRKNLSLIILSIIFFLATSGIIYYAFFQPSKESRLLAEINPIPLINTEGIQEIQTNGKSSKNIAKEIQQEILGSKPRLDTIKYLFFTEIISTQTESGTIEKKNLVTTKQLFEKLGIAVPPILLRTIKDNFMFGYHTFNRNQPFLILKTDYYDNAFVGMLQWEKTMAHDLQPLFGTVGTEDLSQRMWNDVVTRNKDTRVLYNFDNTVALVYMFKDQRTLIISTNNDTLFEVSRRLDLTLQKKGG